MLENVTNNLRNYEAHTTAEDLAETAMMLVEKYMGDFSDIYPREVRCQAMSLLGAKINHANRRGR